MRGARDQHTVDKLSQNTFARNLSPKDLLQEPFSRSLSAGPFARASKEFSPRRIQTFFKMFKEIVTKLMPKKSDFEPPRKKRKKEKKKKKKKKKGKKKKKKKKKEKIQKKKKKEIEKKKREKKKETRKKKTEKEKRKKERKKRKRKKRKIKCRKFFSRSSMHLCVCAVFLSTP